MTLLVDVRKALGAFDLQARFDVGNGLTAFFGQSGSGKTTMINLIAGLIRPDRGIIEIDNRKLVNTERRIFVSPHKRRIGYVFQDARLFPHLTVRQNLLYGRWFAATSDRNVDFDEVVNLLGIGSLLTRRPQALSGGEKQRVAIGRALLANPRILLMDEPLAALDDARKREIMPYLERLRDTAKIPIIYVSHSVSEVARLADNVAIFRSGRVLAHGPASDILSQHALLPISDQGESGSLIDLVVWGHDSQYNLTCLRGGNTEWYLPDIKAERGKRLRVHVRARDVMLATSRPTGISALNILDTEIAEIDARQGGNVHVRLKAGETHLLSRITKRSMVELKLEQGQHVYAVIKAVSLVDDATGGSARPD